MSFIVTAGYVSVETAVPGGRATIDIPRGQVLPADVSAEQRDTLSRLGEIAEVRETVPGSESARRPDAADGTIAEVLARVGDDPARAQAALDAEQAKGERVRSTLLAALTEIAGRTPAE